MSEMTKTLNLKVPEVAEDTKSEIVQNSDEQQDFETILFTMLDALVKAQSHINLNLETLFKLDSDVAKTISTISKNLAQKTSDLMEQKLDEITKSEASQAVAKAFEIVAAVAGAIIGYLLGGVGGFIVSGVIAALSITGALDKAVTWLSQKISGQENPPAWLKGLIALAVTIIAAAVGSLGTVGINAALEASSLATTLGLKTAQQVGEQVGESVAEDVSEELEEAEEAGVEEISTFQRMQNLGFTSTLKLAVFQMLSGTNALGDIITGILEKAGVDKNTAALVGEIIAAIILLVGGAFAVGSDAYVGKMMLSASKLALVMKGSRVLTTLGTIGGGGSNFAAGYYETQVADYEEKYAVTQGNLQGTSLCSSNRSPSSLKTLQGINNSFGSIWAEIDSYKINKEAIAEALLGA